jgi:hypothetical protein
LLSLPFTSSRRDGAAVETFVSLLLRPIVMPEVPGFSHRKSTEIRFFAPGGLVSNLDFVESIFGNAGDPYLPQNDAALDPDSWTGHTGCIILAPHIRNEKKKDLGLPHWDRATERQREQGMAWRDENELYNGGKPFKITCRTSAGVMVTILADNYYGYSKKEVKTQISFSANLFGLAEEEHAGGALTFPSYSLGDEFRPDSRVETHGQTFADTVKALGDAITVHEDGYAVDKNFASIIYVPRDIRINRSTQRVSWTIDGKERSIKLIADNVYVLPSGYKVRMEKHGGAPSWRLVGTVAEGTFCHKPCTVSGGGKSEISKSIAGSLVYGPIYVADFQNDLDFVEEIFKRDYSDRFVPGPEAKSDKRPLLAPERSLGSVIKLLTPSEIFAPKYNQWLQSIPDHIRPLVFIIKRFHQPEWGDNWREHFSVDQVNGVPGHELKFDNRKLVGQYLRVGLGSGGWRLHKLRQDFIAADKVQMEDDISASATVGSEVLGPLLPQSYRLPAVKLVENCEWRLFQRPDDAIHPGMDAQAENDIASAGLFASNYQPLAKAEAKEIVENVVKYNGFTEPMRRLMRGAAEGPDNDFVACSAAPRIVNGKPCKNPRYLQVRPDVARPRERYLAYVGTRLFRKLPPEKPVIFPVSSVLAGRRNNPEDKANKIRALAVYNPIHYQELPELFMDFVCSLTGKSPSTTGAGSEGALTKGPFNALLQAPDLNAALVSYIITGHAGFTTAAGYVGPKVRVDHDISMLIPEIWARIPAPQRDAGYLIQNGYLEKLKDFVHKGRPVLASRLGYRITEKFVHDFFGKVFDNPLRVFDESMLRPETQDLEAFVDGVENIVTAQQRVAQGYFADGTLESCCPPLRGLIEIMAQPPDERTTAALDDPALRSQFTREAMLASEWYAQRLRTKQARDIELWSRHGSYLEGFLSRASHRDVADELNIAAKLTAARQRSDEVRRPDYIERLRGTLGADPLEALRGGSAAGSGAAAPGRKPVVHVTAEVQRAQRNVLNAD